MPQCYLITPPDRLSSDLTIQYVIRPVLAQHLFEVEEADPGFISMRMLLLPLCIAYLPHGDANVYHQIQLRERMNRPLIPIIRKGLSIPREVTRQLILVIDDDLTAARHALAREHASDSRSFAHCRCRNERSMADLCHDERGHFGIPSGRERDRPGDTLIRMPSR